VGSRVIYGSGSVWEEDVMDHDQVGLFKWKVTVQQTQDGEINLSFDKLNFKGGDDGESKFDAQMDMSDIDWESDDGEKGKMVLVACVTHAGGQDTSWKISGSGGSDGASLGVEWSGANPPQQLMWQFKFFTRPTESGCPSVEIFQHTATVSEQEYYWGDNLEAIDEASDVNHHLPQVLISPEDCTAVSDSTAGESRLPLGYATGMILETATNV
jgi:hypothetical protein